LNDKTFRVLEFKKILTRLSSYASSELGKKLALALKPSTNQEEIKNWQAQTTEAKDLWQNSQRVPLGGISDISQALSRAGIGSILTPEELLLVGETLRACRLMNKFFTGEREETFPVLSSLATKLQVFPQVEEEIEKAIEPEGVVGDNASPKLSSLRKQIRTLQNRSKDKLESIIHGSNANKYLQETLVTLRNGRYVIPVKQEYKTIYPGIIHDQSASGATLFIEPMAVVEINNQLRQVEAEEEKEVARILALLSALVGEVATPARANLKILAQLDLAFAKARYSIEIRGTEPIINDQGYIRLIAARHPLLEGKVVPIDLELGRDFYTMVITGPNTGGKTVSLKTAGLLNLMGQSGLHLPTRSGSEIGIFTGIYCDIGDEQSIEQNLSTFSSHMTNIISILEAAQDDKSLVLLDELGAGTDPAEGATLATALLEELHGRKVRTIATTHYGDLKLFAYNTPGVQNASVEFDPVTLRPTYRLLMGLPGRSNALAIASRLGLDQSIIENARKMLAPGEKRVEDLIGEIMKERNLLEQERRDASSLRIRLQTEEQELNTELTRLKTERDTLLKKAREEARNMVKETRREMENLLKRLREASPTEQNKLANAAREGLEVRLVELEEITEAPSIEYQGELAVDMRVLVASLKQEGLILDLNQDSALVQVGPLRVWVEQDQLSPVASPKEKQREEAGTKYANLGRDKAQRISPELDLRGLTVEEALHITDKYLDEALLVGLPWVRLIHGKGTGALRSAINDFVKKHPGVRNYRWGEFGEGGMGVTVVELER
jgi:DNA mismatch repair protein MutS2